MGWHSNDDVRVAHYALACHRDTVDLLITFEAESLAQHARSLVEGGGIVYNVGDADTPLARMPFLDERIRNDLQAALKAHRLPPSTAGLLAEARQQGVRTFAIPFEQITHLLAKELEIAPSIADRALNIPAAALSCALLGYDPAYLAKVLAKIFPERPRVIAMNMRAMHLAYAFVRDTWPAQDFCYRLVPEATPEPRPLVNGNQAVALEKLAAEMTFQTYYPISPATDESVYLEAHETFPTVNGEESAVLVFQTEDESAAVTMASGAALTGARSATATSGPGFSLVITLYQRAADPPACPRAASGVTCKLPSMPVMENLPALPSLRVIFERLLTMPCGLLTIPSAARCW